ncbi:hypothetical protein HK105_208271 [Polyrhizophydium stewartii]|uniref:N-acetyltransferase domain-containing protein n=1 Tax=Polyrhizophydium stewartii TaxID=2732419 RepID=A0ABR4MYH8_9FUNG
MDEAAATLDILALQLGADQVRIRTWRKVLHNSLVHHANDVRVAHFMRNRFPHPYTDADATQFLHRIATQTGFGLFAIVRVSPDGAEEAIGGMGLTFESPTEVHAHTAELGYWLGAAFWGKGIMTAVVRAFMRDFVEPHRMSRLPVPLSRIVAFVNPVNVGSAKVLRANGFEDEGVMRRYSFKHGVYSDALILARVYDDGDDTGDSRTAV